ncbi:MAG TPA: class I SAM-dependent methyltransferase [Acetobacteraceae bacterium]|nr:class I SAM-dependent methyltransferase [Acetobacteraceae bacterium]
MSDQPGSIFSALMRQIHGANIYAGYMPTFPEDLQGWNSTHQAFDEIIRGARPSVAIDVGVWKGASTIYLADLMKRYGVDGAVIAVDTFLGSVEHWDRNSGFAGLIPHRFGMPLLYEQFLSNVARRGLQDRIVPLPQTTTTAATLLSRIGVRAGLIHIDASHEFEDVLRDARLYWDILLPGGFLVGDDYAPDWPGVVQAADMFAAEKGVPLMKSMPKWIVHKPA